MHCVNNLSQEWLIRWWVKDPKYPRAADGVKDEWD